MPDTLIQHFASSGSEALSLLLQPEADVTHIGVTPFALATRLGMRLQIVGVAQRLGKAHGVVLREGLQMDRRRRPSKTRPMVLGTMAGSTGHEIASTWALQQRIPLRFLYLSPAQQLLAYKDKYIDGIASWEPFLTQALNMGGALTCTAGCLPAGSFNVICATESALKRKPGAIQRFLRSLSTISAGMDSGDLLDDLGSLPWLYGRTTKLEDFQAMVQNGYGWPKEPLSQADRACLERSLAASHAFLERNSFPNDRRVSQQIFAVPEGNAAEPDTTLHVGYTDSFMCTAYHLAIIRGEFQRNGFRVPGPSLTRGQRLALLKDDVRRQEISELDLRAPNHPISVISECRRLSEAIFSDVYEQLRGSGAAREANSAEAVLSRLNANGFFPDQSVYSMAHALRIIGNQAVHNSQQGFIAQQDLIAIARECVDQLLRIDEWRETEAPALLMRPRCWNCGRAREDMTAHCHACGREPNCPACHRELKLNWRTYCACGAQLRRTSVPKERA